MQQITDKCRKVNLPPAQQATMEFVPTKETFTQFGLLCSVDPHNYEVDDIPRYSIKANKTKFTITRLKGGDRCSGGGSQVSVQFRGVNDTTQVRDNKYGSYMAFIVPQQAGEVEVSVFVIEEQIKESPLWCNGERLYII